MGRIVLVALGMLWLLFPSIAVASEFDGSDHVRQDDTDLTGSDYQSFQSANVDDCAYACARDARCDAWTFVKPGEPEGWGTCWLKNEIPEARADACCTSGVKARPGTGASNTTKHCSAEAQRNIYDAVTFIDEKLQVLHDDFRLPVRKGKKRRIRRRMLRKLDNMRFGCFEGVLCRTSQDRRDAYHGWGVLGRKIRVCYDVMENEPGYGFCNFTQVVAHEYGHAIGIPKDNWGGHNRNENDLVYQFGDFVRSLCYMEGYGRTIGRPLHKPEWVDPGTLGVTLYQHSDYAGSGRFLDFAIDDLRRIGRNDSISSIRVPPGTGWKLCEHTGYDGSCVTVTEDVPNLSALGMNDKISSIRPVPALFDGRPSDGEVNE